MAGGPAALRFSRGLPPTKQFGERLRLLVIQGEDKGNCFSLLGDVVTLGREGCPILLHDTNLSRKHAEITWHEDHYVIRDLGSSNGVLCNGKKISETKLNPGDILLMGLTVMEVYPAGQTRKTESPHLPTPFKAASAASVSGEKKPLSATEAQIQKRAVERKRLIIIVAIFFLLTTAYFNDQKDTMRGHSTIPAGDDEDEGKPKKKLDKGELAKLLAEYQPTSGADTAQRRDAEVFFRNGVRELQNLNYRRAFTAFDTALTVDPSHELAKIYLKTAKMEMLNELKSTDKAAVRAMKSLRYKEARMHYENISRYLEGEGGNSANMDQDSSKTVRELSDKAKEALKELDKIENKGEAGK